MVNVRVAGALVTAVVSAVAAWTQETMIPETKARGEKNISLSIRMVGFGVLSKEPPVTMTSRHTTNKLNTNHS
jgi:hypothetical protein